MQWWYASTYIVFYILSPFLYTAVNALQYDMHRNLVRILGILWCLIPTFTNFQMGGSNLTWFVAVFVFVSFWNKYLYNNIKFNNKLCVVAIVSLVFSFLSIVVFDLLGIRFSYIANHATHFIEGNIEEIMNKQIRVFLSKYEK